MNIAVIGVGKESPFIKVSPGECASMISTEYVGLMYIIQLPSPTKDELEYIDGEIKGICWYTSNECPIGALMFLLCNTKGEQWQIASLIGGSPEGFKTWGDRNRDSNSCCIIMVDSNTNKISAIRMFGLQSDLLHELRQTMQHYAEMDIDVAKNHFNKIEGDKQFIWNIGRKWVYEATQDGFVEIK